MRNVGWQKQICYVKTFRDVLKIGWLAINERRDLDLQKHVLKLFIILRLDKIN